MRVAELIGSTLLQVAGISLVATSLTGCGCPDPEDFEIDRQLNANDIDRILEQNHGGARDPELVTCDDVCRSSIAADDIDTCTLDIEAYEPLPPSMGGSGSDTDSGAEGQTTANSPAARAEIVVGSVQCSGRYTPECIGGRRPLGHVEVRLDDADALGRTLAAFAHLEAASVGAFLQLKRQLERWGAPCELLEQCEAAARDEVVHAVLLTELARERGVRVPRPAQTASDESLFAAALHNATEGCVSETWAALLAHHQASRAEDPRLRAVYATIAADETRHGQLAWDLHAWFMQQLGHEDRERVLAAQAEAIANLPAKARAQAHAVPHPLGCPKPEMAGRLAKTFAAATWSASNP